MRLKRIPISSCKYLAPVFFFSFFPFFFFFLFRSFFFFSRFFFFLLFCYDYLIIKIIIMNWGRGGAIFNGWLDGTSVSLDRGGSRSEFDPVNRSVR